MKSRDFAPRFEAYPDGVVLLDTETGTVRHANERCVDLSGRSREALEGASLASLSPEEWSPRTPVSTLLERASDGRVTFDWCIERDDGATVELRCAMRCLEDDEAIVTVRKRRRNTATGGGTTRCQQERQELLEGMNDAVMVVDLDGNFLDVNRTATERLGYTRPALLSMGLADVSPPDQAAKVTERIRKVDENDHLVFESAQVTADGETVPVEISASRITYGGEPAILSVARDITERTERERRLRTFEQAIEQTGHAVYITDTDATIEYANPAFEEVTGYDADAAVGETPAILSSGSQTEEYYRQLWETIQDGQVWHEEIENERADGTRYHAEQTIAPIVEDGDVVKFVAIQQDVSERKRRELALERLHRTTRELIAADTRAEIATIATETVDSVLNLPLSGVYVYEEETGLEPVAASDSTTAVVGDLPTVEHGEGLVWDAFTSSEVKTSGGPEDDRGVFDDESRVRSEMVFPLGDHGVLLVGSTTVEKFQKHDVALAGILAGNVEAAMDRVEHERQLERYQQLIENVPVGVYRNTPGIAGTFEEVNPAMVEMFGADSQDELLGTPVAELYRAPGKRELFSRKLDREGVVVDEELKLETVDGDSFWGSVTAIEHEIDGEVYYDGIVQDITERKRQEREIRLRERRFRRLFEGHNAPMFLIDPETGAIERANEAAVDFYGYDHDDLTSMHIQDLNQLPDEEVARRRQAAEDGATNRFIFPHELADGSVRQVEVDSSPIRTGEGQLLFSILHDVTERERNRERLERQNEQLELLNRVVRHDIRNDMSVILGHADVLDDHVTEEGERFLGTLQEHSEHVVELTETARELMETMLDAEDSEPEAIDIGLVLRQEIDKAATGYDSAEFTVEGSLPNVRVRGSEILSSAFRNLLTNAVQHNDTGNPQVTVTASDGDDSVEVRVADNGPGVPDDQKEEIFGKGEHGIDSSGTGLGLYLVHTFVEQFGGHVWVTDNDPRGAVFHVELPKAR